jgi:hypothetical protein
MKHKIPNTIQRETAENAPQKFGFVLSLYQLNISNHLSVANLVKKRQIKVALERKLLKKLHNYQKSIIFASKNRKTLG